MGIRRGDRLKNTLKGYLCKQLCIYYISIQVHLYHIPHIHIHIHMEMLYFSGGFWHLVAHIAKFNST